MTDVKDTLRLTVVEGMDQFSAEGPIDVVERHYKDWLVRVEKLQERSAELFQTNRSARTAEAMLHAVGVDTRRLS